MVDNLKQHLLRFTGNFKNCKFIREEEKFIIYHLSRSKEKNDHKLRIKFYKLTNKVEISGSLRKWCFGKQSLRDLTLSSFIMTLKKLAKVLNISIQELCRAGFTQCEIGLNIWVKCSCEDIISKIIDYHHLKRELREKGTLYFFGTSKKLIIYNKGDEIVDNTQKSKRTSKAKTFEILKRKGYHFLRMEFKLYNQKSFKQHHLGYISTIGDLINNFSNLYEFWCAEISDLIICNTLIANDETTKHEFPLIHAINALGFENFKDKYLNLCKSESIKGLKTARSKAYKEILDVIDKFGSLEEYNKKSLRADIVRTLLRISKNDDALYLPFLMRTLWQKSKQLKY